MGCLKYNNCKNFFAKCRECSENYNNEFEAIEIKDDECQCESCKKIVRTDRIFKRKDNPKKGLCFDCY